MNASESFALAENILATEMMGYSVLQITVGAVAVAAVIGGTRWAFNKALGLSSNASWAHNAI